jgi:hypothetical protein
MRSCLFSFGFESLGYDKYLHFNFEFCNFECGRSFKSWILKFRESLKVLKLWVFSNFENFEDLEMFNYEESQVLKIWKS